MIVSSLLKNTPVIGSALSFGLACQKASTCITPAGKIGYCLKRIVIDCTPPVIKYPALCIAAGATGIATIVYPNPYTAAACAYCCEGIVEEFVS